MSKPSFLAPANSSLRGKLLRIRSQRPATSELFCLSLILLVTTIISGPASAAGDAPNPSSSLSAASDKTEDSELAMSIEQALGIPEIKVHIFINAAGKKTAVLSGNLGEGKKAQKRSMDAEARAGKMAPLVVDSVISLLVPQPAPKISDSDDADRAQEITAIWPRTFSPTSVNKSQIRTEKEEGEAAPSNAENLTQSTPQVTKSSSSLADNLNRAYDAPDGKPYITAQGSSLYLLSGPREKIVAIKRDLLKMDAVRPQVQLDMWTVQISGSPKTIASKSAAIRNQFDRANQAMQMVKSLLGDAAQNSQYLDKSDELLRDDGVLQSIGFDPNPMRPLSLTETLIFLGLQTAIVDNYVDIYDQNQCFEAKKQIAGQKIGARVYSIKKLRCQLAQKLNAEPSLLKALDDQFKTDGKACAGKLLPNLFEAYSSNAASDRAGILQFAQAAKNFANDERPIRQQEKDIARLRSTAAASDRLIKAATDAFAADMQAMFLKPIFAQISKESGSVNSGAVLTGQARLVVTSRQETGINPEVKSYVETTRPKPLDKEIVKGIFSQPQLVLLAAALNPPTPEITEVAPGVAINVRPTVLPDGGSARLQLDFNFGVKSRVTNTIVADDGRQESVPADGIVSNHVATDLTISAFELFNVSSFSIESSYPRSRYLPIIGSIPLLGEIIKKPPKNKVTRHESLVLVNATILPRILDLTHFYGD